MSFLDNMFCVVTVFFRSTFMLILNLLSLSEYNLWALKVRLNEEINPKYCLSMDGMAPRLRFTRPGQWLYQLDPGQFLILVLK